LAQVVSRKRNVKAAQKATKVSNQLKMENTKLASLTINQTSNAQESRMIKQNSVKKNHKKGSSK
jgi:hypothetical protein